MKINLKKLENKFFGLTSNAQNLQPVALPTESHSVTVVIPAFNEEGNIEKLLLLLEETYKNLGYSLPTLIIDDGSTDKTPQLLDQLKEKYDFLRVIHHPHNKGVAAVWNMALHNVTTDWVFWGQADLESDPRTDIPTLLNAVTLGVHGVAGWRQNRGDGKTQASKLANKASEVVFGLDIHDMNWIKLVRRDILLPLPVELITHRYLLAVLAGLGYDIEEIPTPWHERFSGESKFGKGRLVSSAIDFARVIGWFYLQRPLKMG